MLEEGVPSLPALLQNYTEFGGLALHWRFFSSGGHTLRPAGGVLANYNACCTEYGSRSIKSIVQPQWVSKPATAHTFYYHSDRFVVTTERRRIEPEFIKSGDMRAKVRRANRIMMDASITHQHNHNQ